MKKKYRTIKQLKNFAETAGGISPEFEKAIRSEDAEKIKNMVVLGEVDVNAMSENMSTPLSIAYRAGKYYIVKYLLKQGANPNTLANYGATYSTGEVAPESLLEVALFRGKMDFAKDIVESGLVDVDVKTGARNRGLLAALCWDYEERKDGKRLFPNFIEAIKFLLEHDANPNLSCPLAAATWNNDIDLAELLFQYGATADSNLLFEGARPFAGYDALELLVEHGADVNARNEDGKTALMWAIEHYTTHLVELYLEAGADPNAVDNNGNTALSMANDPDDIKLLISYGAEVDETSVDEDGNTLLLNAVRAGDEDLVKLFLDMDADVNFKNDWNESPITLAAGNGHLEIAKLLVEYGADIDIRGTCDNTRGTPIEIAEKEDHSKVASYLRQVMAEQEQGSRERRPSRRRSRR